MNFGEKVLNSLLKDFSNMSKEEYLRLYNIAKQREQVKVVASGVSELIASKYKSSTSMPVTVNNIIPETDPNRYYPLAA